MNKSQQELAQAVSTWLVGRTTTENGAYEQPEHPEHLLRYVADLETLAGTVSELQHDAVYAARSAGCSWAEVGAALGVTKQAAQQRFRIPSDKEAPAGLRTLGPIDRQHEAEALAQAGLEGWRLVETRMHTHALEHTGDRWEIVRRSLFQPGALPRQREGWQAASVRFPDAFYQRRL